MFNKTSTTRVVENITKENIIIMDIYKKNGNTFQLFCNVLKSEGTMGNNINCCVNMLTSNGWVQIVDSRILGLEEPSMGTSRTKTLTKIESCFEMFKSVADTI